MFPVFCEDAYSAPFSSTIILYRLTSVFRRSCLNHTAVQDGRAANSEPVSNCTLLLKSASLDSQGLIILQPGNKVH